MIHPGFLLVLLGAAVLPAGRARFLAALGTVSAGLGVAGLRAAPASPGPGMPPGFAAVEAALLAIGAALAIAAAGVAPWGRRSAAGVVGSAAAAAGGLGLALGGVPYFAAAPAGPLILSFLLVIGIGIVLVFLGRFLFRAAPPDGRDSPPPFAFITIAAGTLLAAAGPGVGLVFLGVVIAAAGGWTVRRVTGTRPMPIAPLLTLILLPAWWLMRTIAGPEGLAIISLPDLPWSPAAGRLLAPALLLAAWAACGLWPLHREEPSALTAPVGALLLLRVAIPAVPDGLDHWRALALPVVLVGLWHAVLTGRGSAAMAALAWVGLLALESAGQAGAGLLLAAGLVMQLGERAQPGRIAGAVLRGGGTLLVGIGALLSVEAGLRSEVVYTVLAAAAVVAATGRLAGGQASTASEPSAT